MKRFAAIAVASVLFVAAAPLTAEQDHARILKELHIDKLRPGVTPQTANYDEAKANPYPALPDVLKLKDGTPVNTKDDWWQKRRGELADDIEREVYGQLMAAAPILKWTQADSAPEKVGKIAAVTRHMVANIGSLSVRLTITLPKSAKPVPIVLLLAPADAKPTTPPSTWRQQVLAKGWGAAVLDVTSVQPDSAEGLAQGVIGMVAGGKPRGQYDWGVLRAWAWGASRAVDYFEEDTSIDSGHIAIAGHSRYGKAALIAMAYDARIAVAYISSSGAGGAALLRRNFGERIENLASTSEYYWFAPRFLQYAGTKTANDLLVDAHDLIALAAPRPIFIGVGSKDDNWADARGMFMAEAAASPVYALLGKKGIGATAMPPAGKALTSGELAFRQHEQGHTMEPNWPHFLAYAQRYMQPAKPAKPPKKGK